MPPRTYPRWNLRNKTTPDKVQNQETKGETTMKTNVRQHTRTIKGRRVPVVRHQRSLKPQLGRVQGRPLSTKRQFDAFNRRMHEIQQSKGKFAPKSVTLTINDVMRKNREEGQHWFSPATMSFFKSRVETSGDLIKNKYFVTSEKAPSPGSKRLYSIRKFDKETGDVNTVGEFQEYSTKAQAENAAWKIK